MHTTLSDIISQRLNLPARGVSNTIDLLAGGATVPFISRYRKEATGDLDEVEIAAIKDELKKLTDLEKRRDTILESMKSQGFLTAELEEKIRSTWAMTELEDIYLPFKPRRRTRATAAREKGLEPLAGTIMKQNLADPEDFARRFLSEEVPDVEKALAGARDIIAEWINERAAARNLTRRIFRQKAVISSKVIRGKEEEGEKYRDYFDFAEPLRRIPGHRLLAIRRGEVEGFLRFAIAPPEDEVLESLYHMFIRASNASGEEVRMAVKDSYKRLLQPSIETEFKNSSREKAEEEAIGVFADNLRQLLLTPPLGPKRILAIDPGFRTGCKLVCLDEQGSLLHNENIYPHPPQSESGKAISKISNLLEAYKLEAIAIGNGTAGRETEDLIRKRLCTDRNVEVFIVNEAGASVYSASKVAREEFPRYDVTVRGAVSIGRRLMDPLAELVKIDPKSIGVGQYQHDVDQNRLLEKLGQVVESVVNQVGVNLNTASKHLLTYISGLGPGLAASIIAYRTEKGPFRNRRELLKVTGLGPRAYEQCAGFLRIEGGDNPLDNSAVHPETYHIAHKIAKHMGVAEIKLIGKQELLDTVDPNDFTDEKAGVLTVTSVIKELAKAGRDPRGKAKVFSFDPHIRKVEDLKEGMILSGLVSNITKFGAFVDIGVKQDGLVHISQLADRFVSDPSEVVKLQQEVRVRVMEIDRARNRIQLSMKIGSE